MKEDLVEYIYFCKSFLTLFIAWAGWLLEQELSVKLLFLIFKSLFAHKGYPFPKVKNY